MVLCIFPFSFTVMKFQVVFFSYQVFTPPAIISSLVLRPNPCSPEKCTEGFLISNTNTTNPIFCVKEMNKSVLPAWFNQFPFEKENLCLFYLQTICQYLFYDI